jgi:hypothetical protein
MYDFLAIEFPESSIGTVISYRTTLTMSRYAHEMLTMYLHGWDIDYKQVEVGSPVRAVITSTYGKKEFVGYVNSVYADIDANKHFVEITALGATVTLKQSSQKVWTQVTADQVITEIAQKHNLSYHCTPHPRVYDHVAQTGETDWEFICKLAYRSGYTLRAEGTSIYCDPMYKDFKDYKDSAPYFVIREGNNPNGRNLYSFSPEISESKEFGGVTKGAISVGGIDLRQSNHVIVTNQNRPVPSRTFSRTESYDRFQTSTVVPDSQVAVHEATAADERARYPYRGNVVVLGDARIRPDMPVYLDGLGDNYSGYWTVLECTHVLEEAKYTINMVVGTDSLGQLSANTRQEPQSIPTRVSSPVNTGKAKNPKTVLARNTQAYNKSKSAKSIGNNSMVSNRSKPKAGRSNNSTPGKWVGASGDLRAAPVKNYASNSVVNNLRSYGVR